LTEEQLRVLKAMNEITSRIDLNAFAQMVGLTPNLTIERVQELVNTGFVRKTGGGYGITDKGKAILKAITPVPKDAAFHFYTEIGQPTGFSAESLKDLYEIVKRVTVESLEFHLYREDFENWIKAAFKDNALANELARLRNANVKGEELRKGIMTAMAEKYGF
jgi:DNA-binding Lrp family transcriptional regulator